MRRLFVATVALALCVIQGVSAQAPPAASLPSPERIVSVRAYQDDRWTLPNQTPRSVARNLARLEPTWVSSLLRFQEGQKPVKKEVRDWNLIRRKVRVESPQAQFDIELNAEEYKKPGQVTAMMNKLRKRLHPNGWFFDFYSSAYKSRPRVMRAAVRNAHANGEWVGGNVFGIGKNPKVPAGSDFVAVQDFDFKINLSAVKRLSQDHPVVFHLGNSPGNPKSDGCRFIKNMKTGQREAYVRERARQQAAYNFRFSYPVFFPECDTSNRGLLAYSAPQDSTMMQTILSLLNKYDSQ